MQEFAIRIQGVYLPPSIDDAPSSSLLSVLGVVRVAVGRPESGYHTLQHTTYVATSVVLSVGELHELGAVGEILAYHLTHGVAAVGCVSVVVPDAAVVHLELDHADVNRFPR